MPTPAPSYNVSVQDLFDAAIIGVLRQGKLSYTVAGDETPFCRYRSEDGAKCAVGQLIRDEFYDQKFEGRIATHDSVSGAVAKSLGVERLSKDVRLFLSDLQGEVHDAAADDIEDGATTDAMGALLARARKFARSSGLNTKGIDAFLTERLQAAAQTAA